MQPVDGALPLTRPNRPKSGSVGMAQVARRVDTDALRPEARLRDTNGWTPTRRDFDFLGITEAQVQLWKSRKALLGMASEAQYQEFRASMLAALEQDGVSREMVDVRAHGSSANFYASDKKRFKVEEIDPDKLHAWFGDSKDYPLHHTFESRYKLGLDPEKSDFDLNFSSSEMVKIARRAWDDDPEFFPGKRNLFATRTMHPDRMGHGYISNAVIEKAFPGLRRWADHWEGQLGRKVSFAVFQSVGPRFTPENGATVQHKQEDWVVHAPAHGGVF